MFVQYTYTRYAKEQHAIGQTQTCILGRIRFGLYTYTHGIYHVPHAYIYSVPTLLEPHNAARLWHGIACAESLMDPGVGKRCGRVAPLPRTPYIIEGLYSPSWEEKRLPGSWARVLWYTTTRADSEAGARISAAKLENIFPQVWGPVPRKTVFSSQVLSGWRGMLRGQGDKGSLLWRAELSKAPTLADYLHI
jgi:hypothetical protein